MEAKKPDRIPPVKSVMTPFPWFIHLEDSLARAKQVTEQQGIRHLPVTENDEPVGVVTARDIRLLEWGPAYGRPNYSYFRITRKGRSAQLVLCALR